MKRVKILPALVVGIVWVLCGVTLDAWGEVSGSGAGGDTPCVVKNPSSGALAIRGTVTAEVTAGLGNTFGSQEVDFTLRLERSGVQHFFRSHGTIVQMCVRSKESIACDMLNSPGVSCTGCTLEDDIIAKFGLAQGSTVVITDSSITEIQTDPAGSVCPLEAVIPSTERASNVADIVLYAVKP